MSRESPGDLRDLRAAVESLRAFNRFWTARIGALDAAHLGTPFSLTEARALYELSRADAAPVGDLRQRLGLDPGYLSRVLADLRGRKLVATEASPGDARRQVARLTPKGRRAFGDLDARAAEQVTSLLAPLDVADRDRLVGALGVARGLLEPGAASSTQVLRPPRAGDLGWVVERHGAVYAREYGWDERFEGLVAGIVAEYAAARDPRTAAWVAEVDGERAGCVFCMRKDDTTAQLRCLLVDPRFRGRGLGGRLVAECVRFAAGAGYRAMVLWTNDVLVDARRLYEQAGFRLESSKKHESFGHRLTGQTWRLGLAASGAGARHPERSQAKGKRRR